MGLRQPLPPTGTHDCRDARLLPARELLFALCGSRGWEVGLRAAKSSRFSERSSLTLQLYSTTTLSTPLAWLGKSSYAVLLLHGVALKSAFKAYRNTDTMLEYCTRGIISFALIFALSHACTEWISGGGGGGATRGATRGKDERDGIKVD